MNGGMVWRWHACVACARTTGRLATHPRFAVQGEVKQCPIAEHENDRLYETLPSEMSKSNCYQDQSLSVENVRLMRAQERRIKEYEHQRDELMSALGAALMHLSGLGVSYPTWWWAMYEKSRVSIHK